MMNDFQFDIVGMMDDLLQAMFSVTFTIGDFQKIWGKIFSCISILLLPSL